MNFYSGSSIFEMAQTVTLISCPICEHTVFCQYLGTSSRAPQNNVNIVLVLVYCYKYTLNVLIVSCSLLRIYFFVNEICIFNPS